MTTEENQDFVWINGQKVNPDTGEVVEEGQSILQVPVTLYANFKDAQGIGTVMLGDFLLSQEYQQQVEDLRSIIAECNGDLAVAKKRRDYQRKKTMLPCITASGLFARRKKDEIIAHSGYICLDIDKGDNPNINIEQVRNVLMSRPEVAFAAHSCSGQGYFAIVRLSNPEYHLQHFWALQQDYRRNNIVIDAACKDTTRFRAATYDPDPYINPYAFAYNKILMEEPKDGLLRPEASLPQTVQSTTSERARYGGAKRVWHGGNYVDPYDRMEKLVSRIEQRMADIAPSYDDWLHVACALVGAFGERGRDFFHRISSQSGKYSREDSDRKYNQIMREGSKRYNVGTIYYMAAQQGVTLKDD